MLLVTSPDICSINTPDGQLQELMKSQAHQTVLLIPYLMLLKTSARQMLAQSANVLIRSRQLVCST